MNINALRYAYLATLADWSEIEALMRSHTAQSAVDQKKAIDALVSARLAELSNEQFDLLRSMASEGVSSDALAQQDAARYRWLCDNNFDRAELQVHTWAEWTAPHSLTGEHQPWSMRVRGSALDRVIDAAIANRWK